MTNELFIVEEEDGEMLDIAGDGGFSVFTSKGEAQDALDSEIDSRNGDDGPTLSVVRFIRERI